MLASFYNPREPGAETLALFASPSDAGSTQDLGTDEVGEEAEAVGPLIDKKHQAPIND